MPAISDHNILSDMGKMTARLCSIARMRAEWVAFPPESSNFMYGMY